MRALVRSAIASVGAQAQLVLLVVSGRAVVGLVADMGVPGGVGVEGAEAGSAWIGAAGDGGAFVSAGGGAVVAVLELCDLVAEPALDAAGARGGAAESVGSTAEGYEGGECWRRKLSEEEESLSVSRGRRIGEMGRGARGGEGRGWTYSKLLGAPPAVQNPAHGSGGDKDDDRDDDCPTCADHLECFLRGRKRR